MTHNVYLKQAQNVIYNIENKTFDSSWRINNPNIFEHLCIPENIKENIPQSSWFKIEKKTSNQVPNFPFLKELENALGTKPIPSEYKTLKLRIFPDQKFKDKLQT